jgi:hypothetical protein
MANINIDGQEYTLSPDKTQDLMQWLANNGGVRVESTNSENFDGQQLLNEQQPPQGSPKSSDGTWDLGTKWI